MIDAKAFGEELAAIVKSATAPLLARIEALEKTQAGFGAEMGVSIAEAVSHLPKPQDGQAGLDGTSVTLEDVLPVLQDQVAKFLETIPVPKDGKDGRDGSDGRDGDKGDPGKDGLDVKDLFRADGGRLVAVMSDGTTKDLGRFVGKDGEDGQNGAPGKDGADGLGFDDLTFAQDDHGRVLAKFHRGDLVKTARLPGIIDRGVYKAGEDYLRGDAVSFGGCLWVAQKDAPDGRPDGGEGWRLAVKKGRDGRDTEAKKVL